ncbi:MAG TPA: FecR domain-containing protein [Sphingobium sp.]
MTARPDIDQDVMASALAWHASLERDDADWDGYIRWLEADPLHREAMDAVSLVAAAVDDHRVEIGNLLPTQTPREQPRKPFARIFAYTGGGTAAGIALMVALPIFRVSEPVRTYSAQAARSRSVELADGVRVTLSPASAIVVRGRDAKRIELSRGEAFFDVRHDPERSLTVTAGAYTISDIGTRFSVNLAGPAFRVGVAEGRISVASPNSGQPIQVAAGYQLMGSDSGLELSPVAPAEIGSWRSGRLAYSDAPLNLVLADIARYSHQRVEVDPSLENTHFSGILVIGDGSKLAEDLATVIGARLRAEGDGVRIGAATSR